MKSLSRRRRRWITAWGAVAVVTLVAPGVAPAAESGRVPLAGTAIVLPPDSGVIDHGEAPPEVHLTNRVHLAVRDPDALRDKAMAVSTPGNPAYGSYLSAEQIRRHSELQPALVRKVRDWLTSAGLAVSHSDWRALDVSGTVRQFNEAFGTSLRHYEYGGSYHVLVPTTDLTIPAALDKLVLGVGVVAYPFQQATADRPASVTTSSTPIAESANSEEPAAESGPRCSKYWAEVPAAELPPAYGRTAPWEPCGYTPTQLRQAYGLGDARLTGEGQVVAVITPSSDTLEEDVNTWSARVGTPPLRPGQLKRVISFDGSPPLPPNIGMVESLMDVEAVHGMAPGADIISIGGSSRVGSSLLDVMAYALDHTDATIVSMSLATDVPPKMQRAYEQVAQQGALQGVGFYVSSGDGGHDPAGNFLNILAANAWFTGVGGTSLAIGPHGDRLWDSGWGNASTPMNADGSAWQALPGAASHGAGGGGGQAVGLPQPWYQRDVVPDSLAKGTDGKRYRVGADVAMNADPVTGMLVGGKAINAATNPDPSTWTYQERKYGGTSLSAPLFAGVQALAQQVRGKPIGFANPALYQRAGKPALRDVVKYTLPDRTPPTAVRPRRAGSDPTPLLYSLSGRMPYEPTEPPTPDTTPGFDHVTGLGSPTGDYPWSYAPRHVD
ncbi:S53 family peptidase [Kibdelosporangium aridum]|uniref:Subtilase family protein n=1 Tax=Kibdelosporangium aridum TaxID=2030 RepID=A0A1Y5Y5I0_KIBAR|nr:S53 family peptidase [Kibdelosporangium aridum]SMD25997.1 Subtilase family protein [Kibdelosporangium aridum]